MQDKHLQSVLCSSIYRPVTLDDLKKAIAMVDQEIDQPDMERYLSWAFKVPKENLSSAEAMSQQLIIQRLLNGNIQRIGKHK